MRYNKIFLALVLTFVLILPFISAASEEIIGSMLGPFKGLFNMIKSFSLVAAIAIPIMLLVGFMGYIFLIRPKMYNLVVLFNMVRADGKVVNAELGRGRYDIKAGLVKLKRPKTKKDIEMKLFDVKKFIYGNNFIQVAQIGADTFVPIHPDSLTQYVDDKGKVEYFIDFKTDVTDQLLWGQGYKLRTKNTFSIMDFLKQHETAIAIGFVVLAQAISAAFIIAVVR